MDPIDLLILGLRILLVVVLYGFLITVMRVAAGGLRPPQARPAAATAAVEAPRVLRLLVLEAGGSGLAAGQILEVADGAVLGRGDRADLVLADAAVSSEHARLRRVGRSWVVADLGSTNGTRLNDALVNGQQQLVPGDVLGLGNVRLQVGAR